MYLLDASVLIDAKDYYYPFEMVNEYWSWLRDMGEEGNVKIPEEIYEEIEAGDDELTEFLANPEIKGVLQLNETVDLDILRQVTETGYANDLTEDEVEKIGKDPFLIAYALANVGKRLIVTTERSKPTAPRANRKIPDVAKQFGIKVRTEFQYTRLLDFRTDRYHWPKRR